MRFSALILFFLSTTLPPALLAQDSDADEWYLVHEDVARISETDSYEKELKELFDLFRQHKRPGAHFTAQMNGNRYFMFYPQAEPGIQGLAASNVVSEAWWETVSEADVAAMNRLAAPYEETHRSYLIRRSAALSYVPDTPEADLTDMPYRYVGYNYTYRGQGPVVRDILLRYKALYEEKRIPYRYDVFLPGLGMDGTLVIVMMSARDAEHLEQINKRIQEMLGDARAGLQKEAQKTIRQYEELRGVMRPDLDYSPE